MSTTAVLPTDDRAARDGDPHVRVAIIGAGFTGLAMVHALRKAGMNDWLMVERAQDVGGVWRSNTYPGIACDVPSHLYSFSFAPNPDWERTFSGGRQIWEYTQRVARDMGISDQARFGEELLDATWDADRAVWTLRTTTMQFTADVVVDGTGVLTDPVYPAIEGLDRFRGTLFHSAAWDHEQDLRGKRVAVIGTGASAIQIVPEIQKQVDRLTVFQRTPGWVIPRNDRDVTDIERRILRAVPALQKLIRGGQFVYRDAVMLKVMHHRGVRRVAQAVSKAYMRRTIDDPALRAKLDTRLRDRLQAHPDHERLVPGAEPAERRRRDLADHRDPRARRRHRRRRGARGRRDRLRNRISRHRPAGVARASPAATAAPWPRPGVTHRAPIAA